MTLIHSRKNIYIICFQFTHERQHIFFPPHEGRIQHICNFVPSSSHNQSSTESRSDYRCDSLYVEQAFPIVLEIKATFEKKAKRRANSFSFLCFCCCFFLVKKKKRVQEGKERRVLSDSARHQRLHPAEKLSVSRTSEH